MSSHGRMGSSGTDGPPPWPTTAADQDSVRLIAVEACSPLARVLPREQVVEHVLPVMQRFAQVGVQLCSIRKQ